MLNFHPFYKMWQNKIANMFKHTVFFQRWMLAACVLLGRHNPMTAKYSSFFILHAG